MIWCNIKLKVTGYFTGFIIGLLKRKREEKRNEDIYKQESGSGEVDSKTKATVCQKKLAVILILSNAGTSFDDYFQVHSNEWSADRI